MSLFHLAVFSTLSLMACASLLARNNLEYLPPVSVVVPYAGGGERILTHFLSGHQSKYPNRPVNQYPIYTQPSLVVSPGYAQQQHYTPSYGAIGSNHYYNTGYGGGSEYYQTGLGHGGFIGQGQYGRPGYKVAATVIDTDGGYVYGKKK